jgi:hypothetical protein
MINGPFGTKSAGWCLFLARNIDILFLKMPAEIAVNVYDMCHFMGQVFTEQRQSFVVFLFYNDFFFGFSCKYQDPDTTPAENDTSESVFGPCEPELA